MHYDINHSTFRLTDKIVCLSLRVLNSTFVGSFVNSDSTELNIVHVLLLFLEKDAFLSSNSIQEM